MQKLNEGREIMENNTNKRHLSVVIILFLVCLMFVSCKNINNKAVLNGEVAQGTAESENKVEEPKEENRGIEELKKENQEEANGILEEEKNNEQIIQENEEVIVEEVDSYSKIICIVNNAYISNNKKYIDVDQVEFFIGEEAYIEAAKDGELYKDENGNDFLPNGYYIRNNYSNIETYEVNEEAIFNLCTYIVDSNSIANSSETMQVSYEEFKAYINNSKILDNRSRIFWVDTKNKVVENITMQFTP